jgi:hypothetical protein
MRKLPSISTRVFYPLVLGVLVVLAYFPTLTGDFILDDRPLIQNNSYVKAPQTPISYLSQEDGTGTGYYRPLINFTYWLDYKIWGMNGAGFRTSNLFYHLLACILFFFVLRNLTGDWYGSFWIAALFCRSSGEYRSGIMGEFQEQYPCSRFRTGLLPPIFEGQ